MFNLNFRNIFLVVFSFFSSIYFCQSIEGEFVLGAFKNPNIDNAMLDTLDDINHVQLAKDLGLNVLTHRYYRDPLTKDFNEYYLYIANEVGIQYVICDEDIVHEDAWGNPTFYWDQPDILTFNSTDAVNATDFYTSLPTELYDNLYGYRIQDEPSPSVMNSSHLPYNQSWINHFNNIDDTKHSLVNMLPLIATVYNSDPDFQTVEDYEDYLDEYLNPSNENLKPDIASLDVYLKNQQAGTNNTHYYDNLKLFREKANGRPMWGHVDINTKQNNDLPFINPQSTFFDPDESYIRWSVNNHLAYGFKGIIYFVYESWSAQDGFFDDGVMDSNKYNWVQNINNYINDVVADVILNSNYMGTFHKGDLIDTDNSVLETIASDQKVNIGYNPGFYNTSHSKSMVGVFHKQDERETYLYVVNKGFNDDHNTFSTTITLYGDKTNNVEISSIDHHGWESVTTYRAGYNTYFYLNNLAPGEGRMIKIKNDSGFGKWDESFSGYGNTSYTPAPGDFDGDGKDDFTRVSTSGRWFIDYAVDGFGESYDYTKATGVTYGVPAVADYDGDGKDDISVKTNTGYWYINYSGDGFSDGWDVTISGCGDATNHPVPGYYDGDNKADLSVKNDSGYWKIDYAYDGFGSWYYTLSQYGESDAHPVPADYDGDGKDDLSVKADWGTWYINYANDGFTDGWDKIVSGYGYSTSHPVPADYDGDGKADLSCKSDNGDWEIDYANNGFSGFEEINYQYGGTTATPVPADYNGDGKFDLSVKTTTGFWHIDYAGYAEKYLTKKALVNEEVTEDMTIEKSIPEVFEIGNYPNPFNPSTNIYFALPFNSLVKLDIYDILGQKIQTLFQEQIKAGNYEVNFDGSNLSSGTYLYSITTDKFVKSGKMLLTK